MNQRDEVQEDIKPRWQSGIRTIEQDEHGVFSKICTRCKERKQIDCFSPKHGSKHGYSWCRSCNNATTREWVKNNYEKNRLSVDKYHKANPDSTRKAKLKYKYGITPQDWNDIFSKQDGRCAICGRHQTDIKRGLAVDHCHETNIVRGLLCHKCNSALGLLGDNPRILFNAAVYLEATT